MQKVIGCFRVSTEDQRLSPKAQQDAFERWCESNEVEGVAQFHDEVSGRDEVEKRPGLLAALAALREHGAVAIWFLDRTRVARTVPLADAIDCLARAAGARIVTGSDRMDIEVDPDDPDQLARRRMDDVFSEWECGKIRKRTRLALAVKKARGEVYGSVPFGFIRQGNKLIADPRQEAARTLARTLREAGKSYEAIAKTLNKRKCVTPRGGQWWANSVRKMLLNVA